MDPSHLGPDSAQNAFFHAPKYFSSQGTESRPSTPKSAPMIPPPESGRKPRKLVLCFDGTGNKFHGDDSDSNILKIFRMLDRTADDQYHYYQPGIGTYVVSGSLSHTSFRARINSWYQKAKDSAVGSSFDQHVVGGYRFLMRFYSPGDEIYMFGFSRGAYIARFLAEMLDYIGLLSHGNEEMVKFAWKAFAEWQSREMATDDDKEEESRKKRDEMFRFMKGFRETFSRPVGRISFLGLFDTVNSVPRFEAAWMQRSKFPYTARSSAKVIRHAVSIDERRAKFRQDLMYQGNPKKNKKHRHFGEFIHDLESGHPEHDRGRERRSSRLAPDERRNSYAPYRARSKSCQRTQASHVGDADNISQLSGIPVSDIDPNDDDQDIDEVWFSGGHADIGGGWEVLDDRKSASHVPLAWVVREAMKAGLPFDDEKVAEMGCCIVPGCESKDFEQRKESVLPDIRLANSNGEPSSTPVMPSSPDLDEKTELGGENHSDFHEIMHKAHTARIHDSLSYGQGLGHMAVTAWKFMEYLPFRRMDLQGDGSWKPIRWPLPQGEVRDIPDAVRVHGSVIRRMKMDPNYRPGNLIIGGGGRGVRKAGEEHGIGDWVCVAEHGDPIGEVWQRKPKDERQDGQEKQNGQNRQNGHHN
ncbi:Fc.00g079670.m01.CDS01 [Cosmosporella sp. VM-42]